MLSTKWFFFLDSVAQTLFSEDLIVAAWEHKYNFVSYWADKMKPDS